MKKGLKKSKQLIMILSSILIITQFTGCNNKEETEENVIKGEEVIQEYNEQNLFQKVLVAVQEETGDTQGIGNIGKEEQGVTEDSYIDGLVVLRVEDMRADEIEEEKIVKTIEDEHLDISDFMDFNLDVQYEELDTSLYDVEISSRILVYGYEYSGYLNYVLKTICESMSLEPGTLKNLNNIPISDTTGKYEIMGFYTDTYNIYIAFDFSEEMPKFKYKLEHK